MQRALVFLGLVLAVTVIGWLDQRGENLGLQGALEDIPSDAGEPDAQDLPEGVLPIEHVEAQVVLGPGGVDMVWASCPAGQRIVSGSYDSVSPGSEVFFSKSFGSTKRWYVGLDNFGNRHAKRGGEVTATAACKPSDTPVSARAEREARRRAIAAIRRHMTAVGYVEEYGHFGAAFIPNAD